MVTTIELHIMYDDSYVEPKKKYKLLATKYNVQTQLVCVLPKTHELIFVLLQFDSNYNLHLHEVHTILINEKQTSTSCLQYLTSGGFGRNPLRRKQQET